MEFNLVVSLLNHQSAKFNSPPIFRAIQYTEHLCFFTNLIIIKNILKCYSICGWDKRRFSPFASLPHREKVKLIWWFTNYTSMYLIHDWWVMKSTRGGNTVYRNSKGITSYNAYARLTWLINAMFTCDSWLWKLNWLLSPPVKIYIHGRFLCYKKNQLHKNEALQWIPIVHCSSKTPNAGW